MTRIANSNYTWSSGIGSMLLSYLVLVLMLPWLSGIGCDVALVIWYWF